MGGQRAGRRGAGVRRGVRRGCAARLRQCGPLPSGRSPAGSQRGPDRLCGRAGRVVIYACQGVSALSTMCVLRPCQTRSDTARFFLSLSTQSFVRGRVLLPPPHLSARAPRARMVAQHTAAKRDELGICAQVSLRYEMPYLLSWVAYHTLLGFDRILLYLDDLKHLGAVDGRKQARVLACETALRLARSRLAIARLCHSRLNTSVSVSVSGAHAAGAWPREACDSVPDVGAQYDRAG